MERQEGEGAVMVGIKARLEMQGGAAEQQRLRVSASTSLTPILVRLSAGAPPAFKIHALASLCVQQQSFLSKLPPI